MTFGLLCHGAAGAIAAVAHLVSREVKAMCEAVWGERMAEARDIHYRLMDVIDALFVEPNPTPVKQAVGISMISRAPGAWVMRRTKPWLCMKMSMLFTRR